jgi:hypothetical protein
MESTSTLAEFVENPAIDQVAKPLSEAVRSALQDGRVLNGPATHNQPCLVVREREGRLEVKSAGVAR